MSEIGTLSLERLNNGAHFLFISNVLARAEADTNVKSKLSIQIVSLKTAKEQEDEDLKISQKSVLTDDIATADAECDHTVTFLPFRVYNTNNQLTIDIGFIVVDFRRDKNI